MSELNLQQSYDRVAAEYVARIFDELKDKPLDRELLDRFAARTVEANELVCDLGCGPGHVARYLHERGVNVFGMDLSGGMLEQARKLNPGIQFQQGDMLSLDAVENDDWGAIIAFYSIIHVPRAEMNRTLLGMRRVLRPEGLLFLAFHLGDETRHVEELWGQQVSMDFQFFRREEMEGYLAAAGFALEESIERDPYPGVEHQSRRAYIRARKTPRNVP